MLIVNRYELQDELGRGGMGVVYQAYDRLAQTSVALKRVNATPSTLSFNSKSDDNMMMSLAHEFRILAGLRHPHIIPVLDYGFDEEKMPFFTMQLLDTPQEFFEVAQRGNIEQQVNFFIQLLQALSYLHQRGIIHRDLKPANVLIQDNQVYVLDFGLSVIADVAKGRAGTVAYMAPEVVRYARATKQSDLFSVGVMLYKLIVGELPYSMQAIMGMDPFVLEHNVISDHPLELVILRLIHENPSERYTSTREVIQALCQAVNIAAPIEAEHIRESFLQAASFIGREAEIKVLENALESSQSGQGSIWLIGGESGVGKSRLMEEIRIRALTDGAIVLRGRGVEGGGLPYQIWRNPLRRFILSTELDELSASILKEIIPDMDSLLGRGVKPAPQLDGKAHQQRLVTTIANVFKKQKQIIVLILEDLQWTHESLEPLKVLSQIVHEQPLLILGNYRDDERPDIPDNIPNSHTLKLARLSQDEIVSLSASMLGEAGTEPQVLDLLQRETEGNVFFLVEVVRALAEAAGSRSHIGEMTLPQTVFAGGIQAIIQRRLKKVPKRYHPLLQLAAVAGRELNQGILEFIIVSQQEFTQESMQKFLLTCANAAVFEVQDGQWQFSHDKIRAVILNNLDAHLRPQIHRQIAEAIEAVYPNDDAYNETLLDYWREAQDINRELYYLDKQAERLVWFAGQYEQAEQLILYSLNYLAKSDVRRVNLLNHLSESHWRRGNYEDARSISLEAIEVGKMNEDWQGIARSWGNLGIVERYQGHYAMSNENLQKSLIIREQIGDQLGVARSLANLGITAFNQSEWKTAQDYYERSVVIQREIGDLQGVALNLINLGEVASYQKDYQLAQDYIQQSLNIGHEIGHHYVISASLHNLGIVAYLQGDYRSAQGHFQQSLEFFRKINDRYGVATNLIKLCLVIPQAELEDLIAALVQGLSVAHDIGSIPLVLEALVGFAKVKLYLGEYQSAAKLASFVDAHPAKSSEVDEALEHLMVEVNKLEKKVHFEAVREIGQSPNLETIIQELLEEFEEE